MIPVLYRADATTFLSFGLGALSETISCQVTEERNGAFELVLKYPITGRFYDQLARERIIKAKPNDTGNDQAFRIYRITTPLNGVVTVYAQHLSYDLANIAALRWSDDRISPTLAMERLFSQTATPHNFTCRTDYSEAKAFSITKPQSVRACLGGVAGSFLDLWGGEYEWDNWLVWQHQRRGQNTNVVIEYGKNLTELEHDADNTDVYTDLLPYAVQTDENGTETVTTLPEVLLPIADPELTRRKTLIKDFSEYFDFGVEISADALRAKASSFLSARHVRTMGSGKRTASWGCCNRIVNGRSECDSHHVNEEVLEATYLAAMRQIIENAEEVVDAVREGTELALEPETKAALDRIDEQIIEIQEAVLALHKAKQRMEISAADYAAKVKEYSERMKALEAERGELQDTAVKYTEVRTWLDTFIEQTMRSDALTTADSTTMKMLVDRIQIRNEGIVVEFKCGVAIEQEYVK